MTALAEKYPAIGVAIADFEAGRLFEHVNIVHNNTVLGSNTALEERPTDESSRQRTGRPAFPR